MTKSGPSQSPYDKDEVESLIHDRNILKRDVSKFSISNPKLKIIDACQFKRHLVISMMFFFRNTGGCAYKDWPEDRPEIIFCKNGHARKF